MKLTEIEADVRKVLREAVGEFDRRIASVGEGQWHGATPCTAWDVRALVNHVVVELAWIPPLLEGKTIAEVGDHLDGDLLGDDPPAAWRRRSDAALRAVAEEGAQARTVHLSSGDATADEYLSEVASDIVVHTWDLARAVGADERIDPRLVEFAYRTLEPLMQSWRAAGLVAAPVDVPTDSDRQTQLLALAGRRREERQ